MLEAFQNWKIPYLVYNVTQRYYQIEHVTELQYGVT